MRLQGICVYCRQLRKMTVDHIVPRSKGGSNAYNNLVWACQPCNSQKSNISLDIWLKNMRNKDDPRAVYVHWFLKKRQTSEHPVKQITYRQL